MSLSYPPTHSSLSITVKQCCQMIATMNAAWKPPAASRAAAGDTRQDEAKRLSDCRRGLLVALVSVARTCRLYSSTYLCSREHVNHMARTYRVPVRTSCTWCRFSGPDVK